MSPGPRRGFKTAAAHIETRIRKGAETRGFSVTRVLTHWADVVGEDIARVCEPVDMRYGRAGLGATLTVCTTGARAPMLEMQKEAIRTRVNAIYGYAAVGKIRITQTVPTGFTEPKASYEAPTKRAVPPPPEAARQMAEVNDPDLRRALETLGRSVYSKSKDLDGQT